MNWSKFGKIIAAIGIGATVPQLGDVLPLDPEQGKYVQVAAGAVAMIGALLTKFRESKAEAPKPQDPPKA